MDNHLLFLRIVVTRKIVSKNVKLLQYMFLCPGRYLKITCKINWGTLNSYSVVWNEKFESQFLMRFSRLKIWLFCSISVISQVLYFLTEASMSLNFCMNVAKSCQYTVYSVIVGARNFYFWKIENRDVSSILAYSSYSKRFWSQLLASNFSIYA